jgi:hypothetical protein
MPHSNGIPLDDDVFQSNHARGAGRQRRACHDPAGCFRRDGACGHFTGGHAGNLSQHRRMVGRGLFHGLGYQGVAVHRGSIKRGIVNGCDDILGQDALPAGGQIDMLGIENRDGLKETLLRSFE